MLEKYPSFGAPRGAAVAGVFEAPGEFPTKHMAAVCCCWNRQALVGIFHAVTKWGLKL